MTLLTLNVRRQVFRMRRKEMAAVLRTQLVAVGYGSPGKLTLALGSCKRVWRWRWRCAPLPQQHHTDPKLSSPPGGIFGRGEWGKAPLWTCDLRLFKGTEMVSREKLGHCFLSSLSEVRLSTPPPPPTTLLQKTSTALCRCGWKGNCRAPS